MVIKYPRKISKVHQSSLIFGHLGANHACPNIPIYLEIATEYKSKGVVFLGVLYGDTQPKGEIFLKKHGSAYPTLLDPTQRTSIDYGVAGVPETYVIDGTGNIIHKFTGPIDPVILRGLLDEVLSQ